MNKGVRVLKDGPVVYLLLIENSLVSIDTSFVPFPCLDNNRVVPVSRWYLDPPALDAGTGLGLVRPGHASELLPDVYVERMLLVSSTNMQGDSTDAGQDDNGNGDEMTIAMGTLKYKM